MEHDHQFCSLNLELHVVWHSFHSSRPQVKMSFELDFVFQDWLNPETFTNHSLPVFESCSGLRIEQARFKHTKEDDGTGNVVWDDAVVLAKVLAKVLAPFEGKRVLELGCGTGFLGLAVAQTFNVDVVLTDREIMRQLVQRNIQGNEQLLRGRACFRSLEWGNVEHIQAVLDEDGRLFDVILLSGCVYHDDGHTLLTTMQKLAVVQQTSVYFAIDFRFDVSKVAIDEGEAYVTPILGKFLKMTQEIGLVLEEIDVGRILAEDELKRSIRIYRSCFSEL